MNEETLFHEALAKSPADRAGFLEQACVGQPALRAAVEALLAAHEAAGNVLDQRAPAAPLATGEFTPEPAKEPPGANAARLARTADYQPNAEPGTVIAGRYTLQEKIGEGGMGEVWVAKQTEPVKRRVALKLIKAGMDTKAVLQRFEAERQALAMMDHPNIAKVLDGGMTGKKDEGGRMKDEKDRKSDSSFILHPSSLGRPFFVMELVNGLALTRFCDEAKLGIRERLELFAAICQAVQHAHQKGIIHRDLKPSNILVTLIDAKPVPKVIDFGVAKAIGGKLLDESLSTQFGAVVGTLEYMSPEQAGFSGTDIDTRADIYSLGVILYELLTGLRPIDAKRLRKAAYTEMVRIIQEEEPSKPSTRLSTDESLPSLAASRHIEPKKLMALLRGELDWVVMKCLEKQRERRYETASGLARDIQRYLADEAVEARPPSAGYRLQKFVRRNKGQVVAAGLVLLALVAGVVGTSLGLVHAQAARLAEAERAEGERLAKLDAEAKKAEAERAQARAEAGEKLAGERLVQVEAEKKRADEEKQVAQAVRDFLQHKLLAQTDTRSQADALVKAGASSSGAKLNPTIRELLDRAAQELAPDKIEASFPKQPLIQAELLQTIGSTYCGIGEYQPAIDFLKRSEALRRQHLGPEHLATLSSMNNLALAYQDAGKQDLAVPLYEEALKHRKARLGPEHPDTLQSMNNLAMAYQAAGKLNLAVPIFEETLKLRKAKLGRGHRQTLTSMNNLALAYQDAGKLNLALPLLEETLTLFKDNFGPEHPRTLISMNNLALAYQAAGKLDLALPLFEETLTLQKEKLGPDHPGTLTSMNNLALAYQAAGKLDLALPLFEETLKLCKARLGPEHPHTISSMHNLALAYQAAGKLDMALPLFEETVQLFKAKLGPEHPRTLSSMTNLARAYDQVKQLDKAEPLYREQLRLQKQHLGVNSPGYAGALASFGLNLLNQHKWADAEPVLRECLALRDKRQPNSWVTFDTKSLLGRALLGQKKYGDAEPLLLAGYEGMKQREKTIPPQGKLRLPEAIERLVQLYEAMDKKDDAAKWRNELEAIKAAK